MFKSTFQNSFQNPFPKEGSAVDWWLSGVVDAANCIAAYQPKGAASLADSYLNLANPGTYDAYPFGPLYAPDFDTSLGWGANGILKCLRTDIVPISGTWSVLVRFSDSSSTGKYVLGSSRQPWVLISPDNGSIIRYWIISTNKTSSPGISDGVLGISGKQPYKNGSADGAPVTGTPAASFEMYILTANNNNSPDSAVFIGNVQAVAFYDITLSGTQNLEITNAMNAL